MTYEGDNLKFSESYQDRFVLEKTNFKKGGFFVDIGAADGVTASNTFLLEKFHNWNGICVDPNPFFYKKLQSIRDCNVSNLCVDCETGKIKDFKYLNDNQVFYGWNFRSGLIDFVDTIDHSIDIKFTKTNVLTVSLNDLLSLYSAPTEIDYISIDTEGNEYQILKEFNFQKYNVKCFTIEYSNQKERVLIQKIMFDNGYQYYTESPHNEDWFFRH